MEKSTPLYITVMEVLKEKIINGVYNIGEFIPTETELEKEFQVSKVTIRKAVDLLEGEGYLVKRSGKGTTVISNSIFNKLSKGESFSTILKREGFKLRKEKTMIKKIELMPQDDMYEYFGSVCHKIRRVYYLDGKPYIHFIHYIPGNVKIKETEDENNFSLYMQLFRSGYNINKFHDEFFVDYPSIEVSKELNLNGEPLLGRKRMTFDSSGKIIEVSIAQYNTRIHNYLIKYNV